MHYVYTVWYQGRKVYRAEVLRRDLVVPAPVDHPCDEESLLVDLRHVVSAPECLPVCVGLRSSLCH